jgi:uncharacterized protein
MPTLEEAKSWYPDDPVHGFDHVLRVYRLSEQICQAENGDIGIVRAAALMHDVDAAQLMAGTNAAKRVDHQHAAAEFADQVLRAEGWDKMRIAAVQHAIRTHRFREREEAPNSLEAKILFDADKLDAIGATGVVRAIAYAVQAGLPAYAPVSAKFRETGALSPGEVHSAYHEFIFKLRKIKTLLYTSTAQAIAERRHTAMADFFAQLAAELNGNL